jgi:hypothetical protein
MRYGRLAAIAAAVVMMSGAASLANMAASASTAYAVSVDLVTQFPEQRALGCTNAAGAEVELSAGGHAEGTVLEQPRMDAAGACWFRADFQWPAHSTLASPTLTVYGATAQGAPLATVPVFHGDTATVYVQSATWESVR